MEIRSVRHMGVSVDHTPEGLNLCCWMSPDDLFSSGGGKFPFSHTYHGDNCVWIIHSNTQLTFKVYEAVCETADRICDEQELINAKRKLSNR